MSGEATFAVRVEGEYACFTRPEFKVERVTYPVITPSAARGLLEAIFWKPEFRWEIRKVVVLQRGQQAVLLRNELADRQSGRPFFIEERRQQRTSLILKDVAYVLHAAIVLRPHADAPVAKYAEQFSRRLERGQYHHTPYLGTREFVAHCEPAIEPVVVDDFNLTIGRMLLDIAYRPDPLRRELTFRRHDGRGPREVNGWAEAVFFEAKIEHGILDIPREHYRALDESEGGNVR